MGRNTKGMKVPFLLAYINNKYKYNMGFILQNMAMTGGMTFEKSSLSPPVNTVAPVVSGTATVGQILSTTDGTWTGTATITFTYQWQRNGSNIGSATASTYTLVDADAGNPIRCVVTGTNGDGNSSANSNATANVTAIAPGAPTIGTATATGSTTATVAFTAPASDGGSTILSYTATSTPGSITGTLTQAGSGTINMTGLTASTSYTFTVTATNAIGTGAASAASNSITTSAPPLTVDYFIVAGGGGGGGCGGGGAGGYLTNTLASPVVATAYTVVVGAGGTGGTRGSNTGILGTNGSNTQFTTIPTYAGLFNGSSQYLQAPITGALTFGLGASVSPMTAEAWFYTANASTDQTVLSQYASGGAGWSIRLLSGVIRAALQGDSNVITGTTALAANTWYHVALSGSVGSWKLFLNGVQQGTTVTSYVDLGDGAPVTVGRLSNISYFNGYISNVRVIKGLAVYTDNFVPSTSPLATTQSAGTNIAALPNAVPTYSGSFNGSNQYLSVASNASLAMGVGDFTIEFWLNTSNIAQTGYVLRTDTATDTLFISLAGNTIRLTNNPTVFATTPTLSNNTWYHIAVVRSGTSSVIYTNGIAGTPVTCSINFTQSGSTIGFNSFIGYISNLRVVKGIAVYTGNFIPPTTPLTSTQSANTNGSPSAAITGTETSLLTCQSVTFVDNSSYALTITPVNSPTTTNLVQPLPIASFLTCQNVTFVDNGPYALTVTPVGAPTTTSSVVPTFGIIAIGGGAGSAGSSAALTGGSGGGGNYAYNLTGALGTVGQGFAGGNGFGSSTFAGGGGGGGGAIGQSSTSSIVGAGGIGISSSITGTATYYAGGGGAGGNAGTGGLGGLGGGGNGVVGANDTTPGGNGTVNTGGGGGGGGNNSMFGPGGNGGSGIAIIKIPDAYTGLVSAGLTSTTSTAVAGYNIYSVTAGTGNITFIETSSLVMVDYLVVAGGGGGGAAGGGGGGAGGSRIGTGLSLGPNIAYTVTVGAGGAGGALPYAQGTNGSNSVLDSVTATGGGGAGSGNSSGILVGKNGGSGGGGGYYGSGTFGPATGGASSPVTSPVQGYAGGDGDTANNFGGGGGGAGAVGSGGAGSTGTGGIGVSSSITSSATYYAGGGGGWGRSTTPAGGVGGGGAGSNYGTGSSPVAGTVNTGGGGGGGNISTAGANGGSGIVIIQVPNTNTGTLSGGLTYTLSTAVAGYNTYIVTAGTGTITLS